MDDNSFGGSNNMNGNDGDANNLIMANASVQPVSDSALEAYNAIEDPFDFSMVFPDDSQAAAANVASAAPSDSENKAPEVPDASDLYGTSSFSADFFEESADEPVQQQEDSMAAPMFDSLLDDVWNPELMSYLADSEPLPEKDDSMAAPAQDMLPGNVIDPASFDQSEFATNSTGLMGADMYDNTISKEEFDMLADPSMQINADVDFQVFSAHQLPHTAPPEGPGHLPAPIVEQPGAFIDNAFADLPADLLPAPIIPQQAALAMPAMPAGPMVAIHHHQEIGWHVPTDSVVTDNHPEIGFLFRVNPPQYILPSELQQREDGTTEPAFVDAQTLPYVQVYNEDGTELVHGAQLIRDTMSMSSVVPDRSEAAPSNAVPSSSRFVNGMPAVRQPSVPAAQMLSPPPPQRVMPAAQQAHELQKPSKPKVRMTLGPNWYEREGQQLKRAAESDDSGQGTGNGEPQGERGASEQEDQRVNKRRKFNGGDDGNNSNDGKGCQVL